MRVAIIPARGGSKRLPGKNVKIFHGKPMIAWSIEAALKSEIFDHIIVSTDDVGIADIAKQWGATVPFIRPENLSDDYTGTTEVIAHATQWVSQEFDQLEAVCCIYATAPFIQPDDLRKGLRALLSGNWAFSFSVTDFAAPIFRSFKETMDGGLEMFYPEHFSTRSQDLPEALHDAGQFYWGKPESWLEGIQIFGKHSTPIRVPRWRVQDIDTQDDWDRAQLIAPLILGDSIG